MGLRETKKARSRQHISDVATRLFLRRGFDEVTVAEIAEAAEVSKMTVFNHFPRKEDLLLDRRPEAESLLSDAIHGRPEDSTPVQALHELARRLAADRHPLSGLSDGAAEFVRLVQDSPSLRSRVLEIAGELETALARLLDEDATGADPHLVAAMAVAAYRAVGARSVQDVLAGAATADLVHEHRDRLDRAFAALLSAEQAIGTRTSAAPSRRRTPDAPG